MLDEKPGLGDRTEPELVEAVITEGAVEVFHEGVLHGLSWLGGVFVRVSLVDSERVSAQYGVVLADRPSRVARVL